MNEKVRHPVVRGHPIHAVLSDLPAALVPTALLAALAERIGPGPRTRFAARGATGLALAGGLAAGAAGWWDWTTMPAEHPAYRPATLHGVLNTAAMAAVAVAAVRSDRRLKMLAAATGLVLAAGAIGGELVFRHGWRVRPAEEIEIVADELRQDGLERYLERAREEVAEFERTQTFLPAK